jgi:predicted nucleotidyltransferase
MPYTLSASFTDFYKAINLPGDHRTTANKRRLWLEGELKAKLAVIETFSFGSVPRFTALQDYADVDILVALHYGYHVKDKKPSQVLQSVRDALSGYATSVRRNGQAVTLKFKSWPNVDIVPASIMEDPNTKEVLYYSIPDMNREEWLRSYTRSHAQRIDSRALTCGPNFKILITMLKHWNRIKNDGRLQSFHIEAIAADAFWSKMTDLPWEVCRFFQTATDKIHFHWYDHSNISAYLEYPESVKVLETVQAAYGKATEAWLAGYRSPSNHEEAIKRWRDVFGLKFPAYG